MRISDWSSDVCSSDLLLIVDHGMGLNSAFLHCQSLAVKVGDRVVQGQRLGTVGRTGRATGPHLHWGRQWRDGRLDPATLAGTIGRAAGRERVCRYVVISVAAVAVKKKKQHEIK